MLQNPNSESQFCAIKMYLANTFTTT